MVFHFTSFGHEKKKKEKWRLKFFVEAEKKITHIENVSYSIVLGMLFCVIAPRALVRQVLSLSVQG